MLGRLRPCIGFALALTLTWSTACGNTDAGSDEPSEDPSGGGAPQGTSGTSPTTEPPPMTGGAPGEAAVMFSGECATGSITIGETLEVAALELEGRGQEMVVVDDIGYVAAYSAGLHVVDLRDPLQPTKLSTQGVTRRANRIAVTGERAYVIFEDFGDYGLKIYDVSMLERPAFLGQWPAADTVGAVQGQGNIVYIEEPQFGVRILDVADPTQPAEIGTYELDNLLGDIFLQRDRLYAGQTLRGISVLDVSEPSQPIELKRIATSDSAWNFASSERWLYSGSSDEFNIIELAADGTGTLVGSIPAGDSVPQGFAHALGVHGDVAYLGGTDTGLRVVNISDRRAPRIENTLPYDGAISSLVPVGQYVYLLHSTSGLHILQTELSCE